MKAPNFWRSKNPISLLLWPFSLLYGFGYSLVAMIGRKPYKSNIPVICIGNIVVGGAGKTPVAIAVGRALREERIEFAFFSRGYGGSNREFLKVDPSIHGADIVGDEPLLLASVADTFICPDKRKGLEMFASNKNYAKYKYIVMDDGMQNRTFIKDRTILVLDGEYGRGNNFLMPAGPLRESLWSAIERVEMAVIIGQDKYFLEDQLRERNVTVLRARADEVGQFNESADYMAFTGIGRPEKFFNSLKKMGCKVVYKKVFGDHHLFTKEDMDFLKQEADKRGCRLITTKKDWVRLAEKYREEIEYTDVEIHFYEPETFKNFLTS